jgi:outer membrane protein OmpA-like peptidoglycan-associated protein
MNKKPQEYGCENCRLRRHAERKPGSLLARLWKWHTGWCPGWKAYQQALKGLLMHGNPLLKTLLAVFIFLACAAMAGAQEADAENCKDHPMFSRMNNFYILECEANFDAVEFEIADGENKTVEGQKTKISYLLKEGSPVPSYLQIRRNYANAVRSLGGVVHLDRDWILTASIARGGRAVWVGVNAYNDGTGYTLTVLELGEMAQEVTAGDMLAALNKSGFIALYINFDTGKSDIKPESQAVVEQIAKLLSDNPNLSISIEGHTDSVGTPAANKTLSEQRARAVMSAVVKTGIPAGRLSAVGWGQEKPLADNRTEEGRAKNRRVEIVKK